MAITYPLSLPTIKDMRAIRLTAKNSVGISTSPFTYSQQVYKHQGQRWQAEVQMPAMNRAQAEEWFSFLVKLNGQYGTFLLGDPHSAPRGSAATTPGTPVVNGASQTGSELAIDGLPASATGYLKAGDYIQLGAGSTAKLHKVLNDVDSNASGQATLDIWPDLRSSPTDGSTVVISNAVGVFRLASNEIGVDINEIEHFGIVFAAVEAL